MWTADDVEVAIEEVEGAEMVVAIGTPPGTLLLQGEVTMRDGVLFLAGVHAQGLSPGALGRAGLNAVARKLMEETGASALVVEGGPRTTGRNAGRPPRPVRFPR